MVFNFSGFLGTTFWNTRLNYETVRCLRRATAPHFKKGCPSFDEQPFLVL